MAATWCEKKGQQTWRMPASDWWGWDLPLVVCVVVAYAIVLDRSRMPLDYPLNSGWIEYTRMIDYIWRAGPDRYFNIWRRPLFPYLVGLISRESGFEYTAVAFALAKASVLAMVVSVAMAGRMLAGRWVAALAVLALPWLPVLIESTHWISPYPMVAALTALSLAFGVRLCCQPSLWGTLAMSVAAGGAWATEHRGFFAVGLGAGFLLLSFRLERWSRWLLMVVVFSVVVGALHYADNYMEKRFRLDCLTLKEEVAVQRHLFVESIHEEGRALDPLGRACKVAVEGVPTLSTIFSRCSFALARFNYRGLKPKSLPTLLTLLLLPLTLIPGTYGWRTSLVSMLVFGGFLANYFVSAAWVACFHRYFLHLSTVSVLIAPVALHRLGGLVARRLSSPWTSLPRLAGFFLAAALLYFSWPAPGYSYDTMDVEVGDPNTRTVDAFRFAHWSQGKIGPNDVIIDCTDSGLDPLVPHEATYAAALPYSRECARLARHLPQVSGQQWLLLPVSYSAAELEASDLKPFSPKNLRANRYQEVHHWRTGVRDDEVATLQVWVRSPQD